jgi:hypothetical protein
MNGMNEVNEMNRIIFFSFFSSVLVLKKKPLAGLLIIKTPTQDKPVSSPLRFALVEPSPEALLWIPLFCCFSQQVKRVFTVNQILKIKLFLLSFFFFLTT